MATGRARFIGADVESVVNVTGIAADQRTDTELCVSAVDRVEVPLGEGVSQRRCGVQEDGIGRRNRAVDARGDHVCVRVVVGAGVAGLKDRYIPVVVDVIGDPVGQPGRGGREVGCRYTCALVVRTDRPQEPELHRSGEKRLPVDLFPHVGVVLLVMRKDESEVRAEQVSCRVLRRLAQLIEQGQQREPLQRRAVVLTGPALDQPTGDRVLRPIQLRRRGGLAQRGEAHVVVENVGERAGQRGKRCSRELERDDRSVANPVEHVVLADLGQGVTEARRSNDAAGLRKCLLRIALVSP
ncbi:MAG TPA: hypothetical protein VE442_07810 [Jatrophihabitans sp.]|nr:hypothetical protein [Jatrophihabitans sp.]